MVATCHEYDYDAPDTPCPTPSSWDKATPETVRDFTYNGRSELVEDRIGREEASTINTTTLATTGPPVNWRRVAYESNPLNRYGDCRGRRRFYPRLRCRRQPDPHHDLNGHLGGELRRQRPPVIFTQEDGRTVITCSTTTGEGVSRKVSVNGAVSTRTGSCTGTTCR